MATASSYLLIWVFVFCLLIRDGLSISAIALSPVHNATNQTGGRNHAVPPVDTVTALSLASASPEGWIKYVVPNTPITLWFDLGFEIDETAMRDTIDAARKYCDLQLETSGDVPLPLSEDPFLDDLGYGAAIAVVSTRPRHRITWGVLKWTLQGLWNFLVEGGRFVEAEFDVLYERIGLVGRGTITEAAERPSRVQ